MSFGFGTKYSAFSTAASSAAIATSGVVVGSGQKLVILCTYENAGGVRAGTTLTDGTNTYVKKKTEFITGNDQVYEAWVCENPTPGTYTVSFDPAGVSSFRGVGPCTDSGLDTAGTTTVVSNQQGAPGTGTDAVTSGNLTPPSQPGGMIVITSDDNATSSGFTQGTGFADQGTLTNWDAAGSVTRIESRAISSTSALPGTFTASATPGNVVTFAFYTPEPGGAAAQNITLNGYAAQGVYGPAATTPGLVAVAPNGYAARGVYGSAAVAPGAVNVSLNGLVAQGIYGALTANSIYPVTLNPVVAQAIFGSTTVTPGAANIAPGSVVGQAIFGAIAAAMGSTQDIQPTSVVGQGVSGSFTLVPGAVALSLGDTVARGVSGSFSMAPGAVALSFTGYAAQGAYGPLTMSFIISMNSIVAKASIGGLAVAVGPVTLLPNSIVAQSEFGPLVVTIPGGTAALIAQSQLYIGMGIRI